MQKSPLLHGGAGTELQRGEVGQGREKAVCASGRQGPTQALWSLKFI